MKKVILLQKIGHIDDHLLRKLKQNLERSFKTFNIAIEILTDQLPLLKSEYNVLRKQYDADKVKNRLKEHLMEQSCYRILGIIDRDIFSGSLNFVFGLADIPYKKKITLFALISLTRLKEEFYRRRDNPALYELRILKEAIHELGHTFGLGHCSQLCVMQFSNHLRNTDKKPHTYCETCSDHLRTIFE